jgi:hypothetical protein
MSGRPLTTLLTVHAPNATETAARAHNCQAGDLIFDLALDVSLDELARILSALHDHYYQFLRANLSNRAHHLDELIPFNYHPDYTGSHLAISLPGDFVWSTHQQLEWLSELLISVGLRPKLFALLERELLAEFRAAPAWTPMGETKLSGILTKIEFSQSVWARCLEYHLDFEVAAEVLNDPDLLIELHLALDPAEHYILRTAIMDARGFKQGRQPISLNYYTFDFGRQSEKEVLAAAAQSLVAKNWLAHYELSRDGEIKTLVSGSSLQKITRDYLLPLLRTVRDI